MTEEKKDDALPEVAELDVTAELKRRLENKRKDDCECALSDAEMVAAARTAHDLRTGKIDPEDIKSPLDIHPALVQVATCGTPAGELPSVARRTLAMQEAAAKELQEMRDFIDLSKKVVESLVEKKLIEEHQRDSALEIMASALQRQRDKETVFVPVSGLDPRAAAQRVIRLKEEYDQVEPVDLTGVLDDVNPICDLHIERLQGVMNVKKALDLDGVPDEIRFVIPNIDLPAPSETDPGDLKFAMTRYVHFDSMPEELRQVVRSYLSLRRGTDTLASRRFTKAVSELAKRAEATFDDGPDAA